jgi:amino acid adenylation domain-containing protein
MQKGMLYHCLAAPRSGTDVEQVIGTLHESLDLPAFRKAWQRLVDRHEALRMRFLLDGNGSARQFALDQVILSIDERDWSGLPPQEQEQLLETFLKDDRVRGFDPRVDIPIRVVVFRLGESDYRFIFTWWHGILDGRARLILLQELFRFYEAFRRGEDLNIPLPRRYTDYTEWLAARDMAATAPYWKELLEGFTEPTPVGTPRLLNAHDSEDFGAHEIRLPQALTSQLRAAVKTYGVTINTLIQGAWALVLGQYGGVDDIVFGTTRACRRSAFDGDGSGEEIVGELINTVPVRVRMRAETRVLDWLKDLRKQQVAVRPYEHSPLVAVQACSGVPADQRLFNSIVVYENQLLDSALRSQGGDWSFRRFEIRGQSGYPLTVYAYGEPALLLGIANDRAHLDDPTAERMLAHLAMAIQSLAEHPDVALVDLPLLTEEERQLLLDTWNRTECSFPEESSIQRCFGEQAARTPDAPALTCRDKTWTYRELDERAEAIARQLLEAGARPETVVGICMERCLDLVAGMLGILKTGAAYLPLDPAYPQDRLVFMIEDARPLLVVSNQSSRARLTAADVPILSVDDESVFSGANVFSDHKGESVGGHHIAYVIYTSGSTGKPKGVLVEHRNVMNLFAGMDAVLGRKPGVSLAVINISFDPSVLDLFWTLTRGYHVVIWPGVGEADATSIPELIRAHGVTLMMGVPSFIRMVMIMPGGTDSLALLRRIVAGGESLPPGLIRDLGPSISQRIVNSYGPTETTVTATIWKVDPEAGSVPIGRPIANTQIYVLDPYRRPVPVGVVGELYIGGAGVARGYLNRPDLTDEKFVSNPFGHRDSERLYRTGDLVRYRPDGMLEFVGRIDNQVKIRGFRVELGEIESLLSKHPDLRAAVVDVQDTAEGGKRLVAYAVPGPKGMPPTKELREWMGHELPAYMVPVAFVSLERIPRTPNGKLDRRALPQPPESGAPSGEVGRAPTPLESKLMEVWCEVLGLGYVGLDENFFDLGGDSLMAVSTIVAIEERFGVKLPMGALFEAPTVAGLAAVMAGDGEAAEAASITATPRVVTSPASFGQESLWVHDRLEPGSAVYNVPVGLRLRGSLALAVLQNALDGLVDRHEALRTTFGTVDGHLRQFIASRASIPLQQVSVEDASESDRLRRAVDLASEEARRPFDLERGPLVRVTLLTLDPTDHVLVLVLHHSICDGRSIMILLHELGVLYSSGLKGRSVSLPPLPIQYSDFAQWQREQLTKSRLAPHLDFWKQQLAGAPPLLNLPTDRPRPAVQSYRGAHIPFRYDREFVERLRALSRRYGCTLFMTLMAGLQVLLARYLRPEERDVVVGFPIAGRTRRETEGIVGFFVNTLVVRTDLSDNPTFHVLLSRVRHAAVTAYAHQDLPFERLVAALNPERSLSHAPVFQVVLALHEDVPEVPLSGLDASIISLHSGTAKFDLSVQLDSDSEGGLTGLVEYATDLFDQCTVERMVGHFRKLLEAAAQEPDQRVEQIPLITESERHQLLVEWNDTHMDYPRDKTLSQLFEEQVARAPEAVALVYEGQSLTYGELNVRANRLANYLQQQGVGPDVLVGICVERSIEMVVGLFGILKAGGAYVPLDPDYPSQRLIYMLGDARTPVLLTQQHLLERIPEQGAAVICLDRDWSLIERQSGERPETRISPDGLAYMIYTSGSTGKPKGALNTHQGICNRLLWMQQEYQLTPADVILQKTPFSFDVSVWEFFWPLITGARLAIAIPGGHKDPAYLIRTIKDQRITVMHFVPSMLRAFLEASGVEECRSLRHVICSGEALSYEIQEQFFSRLSAQLHNLYGPTEAAVDVTYWECRRESDRRIVPIGRPVANTQIYILDTNLQPVPIGVPGELHIGGVQVGRGYHNRPELTAEKFIADPFSDDRAGKLYKTGDLVRYLPDGNIEYLGRLDFQVKLRGFRIELGEIEAALEKHESVSQAVVMVREDRPGNKYLTAYVIPSPGRSTAAAELQQHLRGTLPNYMVPQYVMVLERFPLTPNGKIDRRQLTAPDRGQAGDETAFLRPRTPTEAKIAEVFAEVLQVPQVSVHDNFFDLGGDSLSAINVVIEIQQIFGVDLQLHVLFTSPTVELLADRISEAKGPAQIEVLPSDHETRVGMERAEPRTATERRLLALFERLFDVHPVGVRDNLFDLNDNRTRLDEILAQIRSEFGVFAEGLPVTAIAEHPTIKALARIIDDSMQPASSLVVCLQPHGSGRPLFLIHAGGGYVFFYKALASRLGSVRPVYGVRAETRADNSGRPFERSRSVEELAARYIAEIRKVQPTGPYSIGGACIGGVIAFEMARQLRSQGEELVGPVLLFDAFVLNNPHIPREELTTTLRNAGLLPPETLRDRISFHLNRASQLGLVNGVWYVSGKILRHAPSVMAVATRWIIRSLRAFPSRLAGKLRSKTPKTDGSSNNTVNTVELMQRGFMDEFMNTSARLQSKYVPTVFEGSIVLFKATESLDPEPFWVGLARGGLAVHQMPGVHLDMMEEPAVIETASLVNKYLDKDVERTLMHSPTRVVNRDVVV